MEIQWHGLSCFTIKGKNGTVITDPFDHKQAGIKPPKFKADIALANKFYDLHHAVAQLDSETRVFDWPGEYEAKNIIVQGVAAYDRSREEDKKNGAQKVIMYAFNVDGFKICHLSNLGHKLTQEMIEEIGDVDILLVPVGGENCLDAKKAHEVIEQLDPRVVIPMYYKTGGEKTALADASAFLKEVGVHAPEREKAFKIAAPANLPQEKTEFRILESVSG